jgi:hypothetical protein
VAVLLTFLGIRDSKSAAVPAALIFDFFWIRRTLESESQECSLQTESAFSSSFSQLSFADHRRCAERGFPDIACYCETD